MPPEDEALLSAQQILAVNLYMDLTDRRTMREKLKAIDLKQSQWNAWLRQKTFSDYILKRGKALFGGVDGLAYTQLVKAVDAGAEWAVKYSFEINGTYNPRHQDNLDVMNLLTRLFEIMARHIEPEKLLEIASELEAVGGPIKMAPALEIRPSIEDAVEISETGAVSF